jgi:hypothetical protein
MKPAAIVAAAMILAFGAGVVWANRDRQRTFDYATNFGANMALQEMDGCAAQYPDAVRDVDQCIHHIAETEHFDQPPSAR